MITFRFTNSIRSKSGAAFCRVVATMLVLMDGALTPCAHAEPPENCVGVQGAYCGDVGNGTAVDISHRAICSRYASYLSGIGENQTFGVTGINYYGGGESAQCVAHRTNATPGPPFTSTSAVYDVRFFVTAELQFDTEQE